MRLIILMVIFTFCVSSPQAGQQPSSNKKIISTSNSIEMDFRLVDQKGEPFSLSDYTDQKRIYIISILPNCYSRHILQNTKKKLKIKNKATPILFLNGDFGISRESLHAMYPKTSILMDDFQQVGKSFSFKSAGDFVVLNNQLEIIERGNILRNDTKLKRNDKSCDIQYAHYTKGSFNKTILPAIEKTCLRCHAGAQPYAYFNDLNSVRAWKEMMLRTIRLKRMPPAGDPYYTEILNGYTNEDILKITNWLEAEDEISAGDDEALKLKVQILENLRKDQKKIDNMKLVKLLEFNPEVVDPNRKEYKKNFVSKVPTEKDYYFNELFLDVNTEVAHHIALHYQPLPFPELSQSQDAFIGYSLKLYGNNKEEALGTSDNGKIESYAFYDPRVIQVIRKKGFQYMGQAVYHIPKGSYLALEIHFVPSVRKEVSNLKLAVVDDYNLKSSALMRRLSMKPVGKALICKPYQKKNIVSIDYVLKKPIVIFSYGVHTHLRGRSSKLYYQLPGEKQKKIAFSYPTIQYKMRYAINLKNDLLLPKGTLLTSEIIYDNSATNAANPDPSKSVYMGSSIYEEEEYLPKIYYRDLQ